MLTPASDVREIPELNAAQKRAIKVFDAKTIGDLLNIVPRRYDDYSKTTLIARAPIGEPVTMRVRVDTVTKQPGFRRRIVIIRASVSDKSGKLRVIWFNQPWILEQMKPGSEIFLSGAVTLQKQFGRQLANPIWEPADDPTIAGSVAPVYPLRGSVAQKTMREMMAGVIEGLGDVPDPLDRASDVVASGVGSADATTQRRPTPVPSLRDAYIKIHRPSSLADAEEGRKRLAFDEFLAYRIALGQVKRETIEHGGPRIPFDEAFARRFVGALPFTMTDDQKRAAWASFKDMEKDVPMRRLLQGDVGSGKTVVAAFLMAMAWHGEASAVMMAPTEILAKQHAVALRRFLAVASGAPMMLLTSSDKRLWEGGEETKLTASSARDRVALGRIVVVGTHALLENGMIPPDTAFVAVDEQHRFGVAQREALSVSPRPDGLVPHLLSMTATPIPRSLALTLYGDLDVSIIRQKPKGRVAIKTRVVQGEEREDVFDVIRREVKAGRRAFIICPLIDESDVLGVKSATEEAKRLASGPLAGLRIGLLHGRMSAADKDGVMNTFVEGLLDVLVSTTVVEVGVDVPEATVILVEAADRFGLAQLHQLRGRVGRSTYPSFCFLATDADDDGTFTSPLSRLRVLERTNDGFVIAEEDLKRRGGGNLLGLEQAGRGIFRVGRASDVDMMILAKETAEKMLREDPDLARHPVIRERAERIRKTSHQE